MTTSSIGWVIWGTFFFVHRSNNEDATIKGALEMLGQPTFSATTRSMAISLLPFPTKTRFPVLLATLLSFLFHRTQGASWVFASPAYPLSSHCWSIVVYLWRPQAYLSSPILQLLCWSIVVYLWRPQAYLAPLILQLLETHTETRVLNFERQPLPRPRHCRIWLQEPGPSAR